MVVYLPTMQAHVSRALANFSKYPGNSSVLVSFAIDSSFLVCSLSIFLF